MFGKNVLEHLIYKSVSFTFPNEPLSSSLELEPICTGHHCCYQQIFYPSNINFTTQINFIIQRWGKNVD